MLNTKQKLSIGSVLISISIVLFVILILIQTSEVVVPFYEYMFLAGGIIIGLGATLSILGLADQGKSKIQ